MTRRYTVAEIDRMRENIHFRLLKGITRKEAEARAAEAPGIYIDDPGYPSDSLARRIEDHLRTYMLAGIGPEELE